MGHAPIKRETLAQPSPQAQARPTRGVAVQGGEGNTREQAGDTLLQVAEGQRSDQSDQAPSQHAVRLAAAAVHANPLAVHGLQFRLDREDEDLDVG